MAKAHVESAVVKVVRRTVVAYERMYRTESCKVSHLDLLSNSNLYAV